MSIDLTPLLLARSILVVDDDQPEATELWLCDRGPYGVLYRCEGFSSHHACVDGAPGRLVDRFDPCEICGRHLEPGVVTRAGTAHWKCWTARTLRVARSAWVPR